MHTGPQNTSTQQQVGGTGGRGAALLIGGIAFAVVFLLIVGVTVGYLVLRPGGGGGPGPTSSSSASESVDPESTSASATPSPTPTDVEAERCWTPESERTSSNPSGKLRGGGLQFIPPAIYDERGSALGIAYANDVQVAYAHVQDDWYSSLFVGAVVWQPGIEYPGAEVASQTLLNCFFSSSRWDGTSGRSLDDEITEPVTISGMPGYRTTATVNFAASKMDQVTATEMVVVVLETDQGPSMFVTETNVGTTEHEEAADQAYESLTGIS